MFCCKYSPVYIPAKPVKHQMLLFFCSLGSVTGNQPTTMLMGVQAVEKGMLLLKILHQSFLDALGFFVRHNIHIVCSPRELAL